MNTRKTEQFRNGAITNHTDVSLNPGSIFNQCFNHSFTTDYIMDVLKQDSHLIILYW